MSLNNTEQTVDLLSLQQSLKSDIDKYDFFSLLRYLENDTGITNKKFEQNLDPAQEKIRITQNPSLSFPVSEIKDISLSHGKINVCINNYGLLSINSPLPIHLLEHIFERKHHYGDSTWADFINIIQHRLTILFYQSWASSQSILSLEAKCTQRFDDYLESLIGLDKKPTEDSLIDNRAKIFFSGYGFKNRSSYNLVKLLSQYFQTNISIIENIGGWHPVDKIEQTCLGVNNYTLGEGLLLGSEIYDSQTKFRVVIGPLNLEEYQSFFKGEENYNRLAEWLDDYAGLEYKWEVQPILDKVSVPPLILSGKNKLGLTSWLGSVDKNVDSLILSQPDTYEYAI